MSAVRVAHTPGPWNLEAHKDGAFTVSVMLTPISQMVICARNQLGGRADESVANAKLIAAAPDLLAALEVVVNDWTAQFERNGHLAPAWCKQARAAIAKAVDTAS